MSSQIEEQIDVAVQEAATTTAVESESPVNIKRTYQHTDDYKKLKMIRAVDLGLTVSAASRVVQMSPTAANLVMKKFQPLKRKKHDSSLMDQIPEQTYEKDLMDRAELDSMLDVIEAREKGSIGKTNILKMDQKVNRTIRKILDKDVPLYELTLPEKVKNSDHQLPQPG